MIETAMDPVEEYQQVFKLDKYRNRLTELAIHGKTSLSVDFEDLIQPNKVLAEKLAAKPQEYLPYLAKAAYDQLRIEDPDYAEKIGEVEIRVYALLETETINLRDFRSKHLDHLIAVEGIVVAASQVKPTLHIAAYKCKRCGTTSKVEQTSPYRISPEMCLAPDCGRDGPFELILNESTKIDTQNLELQEKPEALPPGQLPQKMTVVLRGEELVETTRPGDRVTIVGVPKAALQFGVRSKLCKLDDFLEANSVDRHEKEDALRLTPDEEAEIRQLAQEPNIIDRIVKSIAPSIYGFDAVKRSVAFQQFGGVPKKLPDRALRGDIHVLMIGDPGIAKSQILVYAAKLAPRGLFTTGKGTTAVGLTAAVVKDKDDSWSLSAGALVLADQGFACIDELDKMNEEDRKGLHEAMEQQTVSIAKGGIVATLNSRTAILAACNPTLGRYDPNRTVLDNINLPASLLSRFDLIFVLRDVPNREEDSKKGKHMLEMHRQKGIAFNPILIAPDLLRKYIFYAKKIEPTISKEAEEVLHQFYVEMRAASNSDSISITARHLDGLVRLAEAHARMALHSAVTVTDAQAAISLMQESLRQVDIEVIMTGITKNVRQIMIAIMECVKKGPCPRKDVVALISEKYKLSPADVEKCIKQLLHDGTLFEPHEGNIGRA